jgi:hypothetical protein
MALGLCYTVCMPHTVCECGMLKNCARKLPRLIPAYVSVLYSPPLGLYVDTEYARNRGQKWAPLIVDHVSIWYSMGLELYANHATAEISRKS